MPEREKRPQSRQTPHVAKRPRFRDPGWHEDLPLAWRFSSADRGGRWPWNDQVPLDVVHKLADFEKLARHELHGAGNLAVELASLAPEALERLRHLQLDDLDELFHFRLGNKTRVWCIQDRNMMRILWYDPEHEVCPSLLRNT